MVDVSDLGIELKDMNVPWDPKNVHPDNYDEGEYVAPTTHQVKRLKRIVYQPTPFALRPHQFRSRWQQIFE